MREQQHHAAQPSPFLLRAGDELVDDDLSDIGKISELSFPHHQSVGTVKTIAVFKARDARLRERTVINLHGRLVRRKMFQWRIGAPVLIVQKHDVPVTESSARAVL